MTLDIPTLYFISVITNVAMSLAVVIVALRQAIPGLKQLAWALVANSSYYLVLGTVSWLPDILVVPIGNAFGSFTLTLLLLATLSFSNRRMAPLLYVLPVLLMALVSLALIQERTARLSIASLILSYQIALILWTLLKSGASIVGRGRLIMMAAVTVSLSMMLYRFIVLGFGWQEASPFQSKDSLNTIFYMVNYLGMFFVAFGFVLSSVEQAADQNRRLALKDPLTDVANRRALFEAMNPLFSKAGEIGLPMSLLILDIDLFKLINDRFGHQVGDVVLQQVATRIQERLRNQDILGRFGGEEFLIILPDTPPEGAKQLATDLCHAMASEPIIVTNQEIMVSISVGLFSSPQLSRTETPDLCIALADEALYRAKANGRNRVEIAASALAKSA
jgi:diguanylate cyclase (GGDEF)-like protein